MKNFTKKCKKHQIECYLWCIFTTTFAIDHNKFKGAVIDDEIYRWCIIFTFSYSSFLFKSRQWWSSVVVVKCNQPHEESMNALATSIDNRCIHIYIHIFVCMWYSYVFTFSDHKERKKKELSNNFMHVKKKKSVFI